MTISTSMSNLHSFTLITLVDITKTGVLHADNDDVSRNQQRNWETVLQTIGLRAQPLEITSPNTREIDLRGMEFGEMYRGLQRVWAMSFAVEHADVWLENRDPVAGLCRDFDQVPILTGLTETARFMLPIFYSSGAIKNIYFKSNSKDLNTV